MKNISNIDIYIPTDQEITDAIEQFIDSYFKDIQEYIELNYDWFKKHNIKKLNTVNYFSIRRFLVTATNNLLEIDKGIRSGVLDALITDVEYMYSYYEKIFLETRHSIVVMEKFFLKTFECYLKLEQQLEEVMIKKEFYTSQEKKSKAIIDDMDKHESLNMEQTKIYKAAKRQNTDAIHILQEIKLVANRLFEEEKLLRGKIVDLFDSKFHEQKKYVLTALIDIINTTYFCLDQALWYYAENSQSVKRYFRISQIKGDFSLRTYIEYYLKGIGDSSSSQEVKTLNEVLKELYRS